MHSFFLVAHSALRWVLLFGLIAVVVAAVRGWRASKPYETTDRKRVAAVVGVAHLQVLIGLIVYGVTGPWITMLQENARQVMSTRALRFFAVEHSFSMIVAVVILQIGVIRAKRAEGDGVGWRRLAIASGLSLLIIVGSIPWPFMPYGRALLRLQ